MADLQRQLEAGARTWTALIDILGLPRNTCADDVLTHVRQLAADRNNNPELQQLSPWGALPSGIPLAELERRIALAMTHLHWTACSHTQTAFLILRDGVPPAEWTRRAPKETTRG